MIRGKKTFFFFPVLTGRVNGESPLLLGSFSDVRITFSSGEQKLGFLWKFLKEHLLLAHSSESDTF